ncbi:hypothetical protein Tfont_00065 [Tepidimonas fonticaldi]|uniref:DUF1854 domain-containing protein n=1 Tax=Tepidimonas fonticaldi TaxID=1101373 RepID=A0A1A6DVJ1_9BURK|nr:DUF1854 domain-containing protein [Tepidimonas fonticaldi]OBS30810.1 hypothetical protein A9O67_07580 [Tepidimonas fonticaldi]TSE38239.1 hypothetical protein Tfont_00065 [Tepidimonas fonticaldi]
MTTSLPATQAPELRRNSAGRLEWRGPDGEWVSGVVPVRAFPIQAPDRHVSLVGPDGHEVAYVESLAALDAPTRALIEQALHEREFTPVIRRLLEVSSFATPSTWTVETDRGVTRFVLKGEEDIRRLARDVLLIQDSHGVQYLIRRPLELDRHSRRLLDRFL